MTPLTIVELILKIVLEAMQGQPPDVREAMWRRHMENLEKWDQFWEKLIHPETPRDQT